MSTSDDKPESAKMLEEIEKAQSDVKSQASKSESIKAQSEPAKAPVAPVDSPAPVQAGQAEGQGTTPASQDKYDAETKEWARKKGIKDADSALRSLRELEVKFGKSQAELKEKERLLGEVPRGTYQPEPQFAPPYQPPFGHQPEYARPSYYPLNPPSTVPQYIDREKILEQEAKRFNMAPEDFERVLSVSSEIASMQTRKLQAQMSAQFDAMNRETRRNSEMRELLNDPLFTNKQVQFEMHRVFEENPRAFQLEPAPYIYAFNEAQRRLARQYLQKEGGSSEEGLENSLPTNPPPSGDKVKDGVERGQQNAALAAFGQAKTADEQRKILEGLGAVKSY